MHYNLLLLRMMDAKFDKRHSLLLTKLVPKRSAHRSKRRSLKRKDA